MPAKHHSTGDWDFETAHWELYTSLYVSAPTSLFLYYNAGDPGYWVVLCKTPDTQAIDEGRIVTWGYLAFYGYDRILLPFRNQSPIGAPTLNDSYYVRNTPSGTWWYYRDALGVDTNLGSLADTPSSLVWRKTRVTWWNGKNLQNVDATVCRFEVWNGTAWVQPGVDLYDTNERNKGSATNRAGVGVEVQQTGIWLDDTEIWCTGA